MQKRFLACLACGVCHPHIHGSRTSQVETIDEALQALDAFSAWHCGHELTEFRRTTADAHSDRPLWDPRAAITFEASDGHKRYIVTSVRHSLEEPRHYFFTAGELRVAQSEVGIDDRDLRRGLDMKFHPHAIRPTKLERFVRVLRDVISRINPEDLTVAFDAAEDPNISIARMPDQTYQELIVRCGEIFDDWELTRVNTFLRENRDEDGLLALRVRRQVTALHA